MSDYRITKAQRAYLDTLVCQRISDDKANRAIISKFQNDSILRVGEGGKLSFDSFPLRG